MGILIKVKTMLRPFMPQWILDLNRVINKQVILSRMRQAQSRYPKVLSKLRKKEKIKIVFFLIHSSIWKYDNLFQLMLNDNKFDPVIVVCPYIFFGKDNMIRNLKQTEEFIRLRKYPYVMTLNFKTGEWLDVKKEIKPDIIFFVNPYEGATKNDYFIYNFPNSLTCYVPYSSMICNTNEQYNRMLLNIVWRFFTENTLIQNILKEKAYNKGYNNYVSGSPVFDAYFDKNYTPANAWKHKQLKKIIWAPHHSINKRTDKTIISFSNFLEYAILMVEIAARYKNEIQIAFKPHPLLYPRLVKEWGQEQTDDYYNKWESMPNTQLELGEYIDLFYTSDALIFDSVSFINEYLYTKKPSLFIYKPDIDEQLNQFGHEALSCHQKATSQEDITKFIEQIISGSDDPMKDKKEQYYTNYLVPPNGKSASENIFDYIKEQISQ